MCVIEIVIYNSIKRYLKTRVYCRDISVKIKSQLAVKRRRGDFVGSFAAYGYQKDPANHTKLIVDELAAENVQSIFRWKISGMSNQGIADCLNAEKVPSPAARKLQSGAKLSLHFRKSDEPPWSAKAVDRMLKNSRMMPRKSWLVFTSTLQGIRKSTNARKWYICSKIAKMVPSI